MYRLVYQPSKKYFLWIKYYTYLHLIGLIHTEHTIVYTCVGPRLPSQGWTGVLCVPMQTGLLMSIVTQQLQEHCKNTASMSQYDIRVGAAVVPDRKQSGTQQDQIIYSAFLILHSVNQENTALLSLDGAVDLKKSNIIYNDCDLHLVVTIQYFPDSYEWKINYLK